MQVGTAGVPVYTLTGSTPIFEVLNMSAELRYTSAPVLLHSPIFVSWPARIRATTVDQSIGPLLYGGRPVMIADGVELTLVNSLQGGNIFVDFPTLQVANGGRFGPRSQWLSFSSGMDLRKGAHLPRRTAFLVDDAVGAGTLSTQTAYSCGALAKGDTANICFQSLVPAEAPGGFNYAALGTAPSVFSGGLRVGARTASRPETIVQIEGNGILPAAITQSEEHAHPSAPAPGSSRSYVKDGLFVIQYNDGGTVKYTTLDLRKGSTAAP